MKYLAYIKKFGLFILAGVAAFFGYEEIAAKTKAAQAKLSAENASDEAKVTEDQTTVTELTKEEKPIVQSHEQEVNDYKKSIETKPEEDIIEAAHKGEV